MPDSLTLCSAVRAVRNCREPRRLRHLLPSACQSVLETYLETHQVANSDCFVIIARGGFFFIPALFHKKLVNPFAVIGPARDSLPQLFASPLEAIRNRHCHLLDVVADTGKTLLQCAELLHNSGSASVSAVAVFGHPDSEKFLIHYGRFRNVWIYDTNNCRENELLIPDAQYDVGDMFTFACIQRGD